MKIPRDPNVVPATKLKGGLMDKDKKKFSKKKRRRDNKKETNKIKGEYKK